MYLQFIKQIMEKYIETNTDAYLALLDIRSRQLGTGLLSLSALLFKRPARGLLLKFSRITVIFDNNDNHLAVLTKRQHSADIDKGIQKDVPFLSIA